MVLCDGKNNLPDYQYGDDPVLKAIVVGETGSKGFRKLQFAHDKDSNLRPGEFGLGRQQFVGQWSKVSIFFSAIDVDGNRLVRSKRQVCLI